MLKRLKGTDYCEATIKGRHLLVPGKQKMETCKWLSVIVDAWWCLFLMLLPIILIICPDEIATSPGILQEMTRDWKPKTLHKHLLAPRWAVWRRWAMQRLTLLDSSFGTIASFSKTLTNIRNSLSPWKIDGRVYRSALGFPDIPLRPWNGILNGREINQVWKNIVYCHFTMPLPHSL